MHPIALKVQFLTLSKYATICKYIGRVEGGAKQFQLKKEGQKSFEQL